MVDWNSKSQRAEFNAAVIAVQAGDSNAAEELLVALEPLVLRIAKRYGDPRRTEFDDLLQVGRLGIYQAMLTYDPSMGASVPNYCFRRITWNIRKELDRSPRDFILDNALSMGQTSDANGTPLAKTIPDRQSIEPAEYDVLDERRQAALNQLGSIPNEVTRDVVRRRLHGEKYTDIAKDLGVSRARVQKRGKDGLAILGLGLREVAA